MLRQALLATLATCALTAPPAANAAATGCKLQSIDVPVTMKGTRPMVSAKIDGEPVELLLDSGAFFSIIDSKFATDRNLKPVNGGSPIGSHIERNAEERTTGVAGKKLVVGLVQAKTFEFAGAKWPNAQFLAQTFPEATGILGQNLLHGLDDDYDLKNGKVRLIDPAGCGDAVLAYWVAPGEAYSVVDLSSTRNFHTIATIEINGVRLKAYFDTGAAQSFVTQRAAERAGVKTTDPGVKPAGFGRGLDGPVKIWVAPFASIKIGDEEIKNTRLSIGETEARDFDVLVGADFFLSHHVYVANSQGKIYFTYSGGRVFLTPRVEEAASGDPKAEK